MKKKELILNIIKIAIFALLLFVILLRVNYILRNKELTSIQDNFANLPRDSVDVVFIGQSHCFCSIDPNILYDEYGINSFLLCTSAQTVPMSYYAAMEAIELQHPDKIVMEVAYCANDFETVPGLMTHAFFDGMPNCKARSLALKDLISKEERLAFVLNLAAYHTRWKELTAEDYKDYRTTAPRGEFYSDEVGQFYGITYVSPDDKLPMPDICYEYMENLINLCEENNVELILFCAPFGPLNLSPDSIIASENRERLFNGIQDSADAYGIRYYNMFNELEDLYIEGLNDETDWMDAQHLNRSGQALFTRYMASKGYFD